MTDTSEQAIAALALQVTALKGNLGQTRADLETARKELAERIDAVMAALNHFTERDPKGPPVTWWPSLNHDAQAVAMTTLADWLRIMREWHPSYFAPIADCWASHPEVVIELHNVMTEFTRVYRMKHPPLADALVLYDRWLPGMLRRCGEVMRSCGPAGCARKRQLSARPYDQ